MRSYRITDEVGADGIRYLNAAADISGLGEIMLLLDASGIPQENLPWYALYVSLLGELDTARHSQQELSQLCSRYLYGWSSSFSEIKDFNGKTYRPYLSTGWVALGEDLEAGYDLVYELLFETEFTDSAKLRDLITAECSMMKNAISYGAYNVMLYRSLGAGSPALQYNNELTGLANFGFLQKTAQLMETAPEQVITRLQEVQQFLKNRTDAVSIFAGDEALFEHNRMLADAFFAKLDNRPVTAQNYSFEVPAQREAFITDSSVQYNGMTADYETLGLDGYSADLQAISALVLDRILIPQLRERYGVYTPMHGFTENGAYLLTYSDPNIEKTFDVYRGIADTLRDLDITQEELDGYILSAYADLASSEGELSGAITAVFDRLGHVPEDLTRQRMRELKSLTPEAVRACAEVYEKLATEGRLFTVGSAEAVKRSATLYDAVLNPFYSSNE